MPSGKFGEKRTQRNVVIRQRNGSIEQRQLQPPPAPRRCLHRRKRGNESGQSANEASLVVVQRGRRAFRGSYQLGAAGERAAYRVTAAKIAVRAIVSKPAHGGDHEAWIRRCKSCVVDPQLQTLGRRKRIDQNVS